MAKLQRQKKIELESDSKNDSNVWSIDKQQYFVQCNELICQIVDQSKNIVDQTTVNSIAHSLVIFGDKGKSLFTQVCLFQKEFDSSQLEEIWEKAERTSRLKRPSPFIKICVERGLNVSEKEEAWEYKIKEPGKLPYQVELTDEQSSDIKEYGFIIYKNAYHFANYNKEAFICTLECKSNFILKILFHINRGKQNKRVIELENIYNRKVNLDVDTVQLTSFQKFKEFTEGAGNFLFDGGPLELAKIKNKLFKEEKPSMQIDMLGWTDREQFFAFSNGLYDIKFHPVDEHGIVELKNKHYFIPCHPGTDRYQFLNEKRFRYLENEDVTFEQWSDLYCKAFGDTGKVALLFGIATLFSDHIFAIRGNMPMLFLYGEGGSGKSRVGMYLQHLWGDPQPPLKLSERANTDKGKIRKLAQYINAMAVFEEFINELDMAIIKTITGMYDRFGYERSTLDSKYGTETVPINSTAFITGNSYPNDDPLMQRLILIDYHANIRSDKVVNAFDELTVLNRKGITSITGKLLQYREIFCQNFEVEFRSSFNKFKTLINKKNNSVIIPDRMIENYSIILTTYQVSFDAGLNLPFNYLELESFLVDTILKQNDKRDTGSVTQRFWDIFLQLANEGQISHGKEYKLRGDELTIRFKEVYGMYLEKHQRLYRAQGLGNATLLDKLKNSGAFVESKTSTRYSSDSVGSGHTFKYSKIGVDLLNSIQYWAKRQKGEGFDAPDDPGSYNLLHSITHAPSANNSKNMLNNAENDDLPF